MGDDLEGVVVKAALKFCQYVHRILLFWGAVRE